jgi:sugar phosphate isomerase/epimerase
MTQPIQILGSYWTLAVGADPTGDKLCLHDFRSRVEAAAKAGFTAMGFWHTDLRENKRKLGFAEMKRIFDGNGIREIEVEWLLDWYCTDQRRVASDETRKLLLDAAEEFRARHIKVSDLGNDGADVARMTEEYAKLCREAGERGTNVLFEMLPGAFSRLPSLDAVVAMCRGSGAKNGGIMLDNLHLQRTATLPEDIVRKIPRELPLGVEINDGMLATPVNFLDSVINKRLLPGDGEFDIGAFLRAVWTLGYDGPVGVEVLNEYVRKWPLNTAADEAFVKTTKVVTAAREQWEAKRGDPR